MSSNGELREGVRRELGRNLELCKVTPAAIALELGFTEARLAAALEASTDSDPADVWILRDFLEKAVREGGGTPERYSVQTETARADAQRWFGLPVRPEWLRRGESKAGITDIGLSSR
jgi:hypothetical protein